MTYTLLVTTDNVVIVYTKEPNDAKLNENDADFDDAIYTDCTKHNCKLIKNITSVPKDFMGNKYIYDNGWKLNPDYEEPIEINYELLETLSEDDMVKFDHYMNGENIASFTKKELKLFKKLLYGDVRPD